MPLRDQSIAPSSPKGRREVASEFDRNVRSSMKGVTDMVTRIPACRYSTLPRGRRKHHSSHAFVRCRLGRLGIGTSRSASANSPGDNPPSHPSASPRIRGSMRAFRNQARLGVGDVEAEMHLARRPFPVFRALRQKFEEPPRARQRIVQIAAHIGRDIGERAALALHAPGELVDGALVDVRARICTASSIIQSSGYFESPLSFSG